MAAASRWANSRCAQQNSYVYTTAHLMGLDHKAVTYLHSGRQESMADAVTTGAHVHHEIIS